MYLNFNNLLPAINVNTLGKLTIKDLKPINAQREPREEVSELRSVDMKSRLSQNKSFSNLFSLEEIFRTHFH